MMMQKVKVELGLNKVIANNPQINHVNTNSCHRKPDLTYDMEMLLYKLEKAGKIIQQEQF